MTTIPIFRLLIIIVFSGIFPVNFLSAYSEKIKEEITDSDITEFKFASPDRKYYPETWYHFIGGNVSKSGVTADLEAIAKAGISGIQLFHGSGGSWPNVFPQIQTLSKDWDNLVLWTARECKRLNLEFTMQNCPGWSYAGGPWITPENSMRHLVYSRGDVEGGKPISVQLAMPQPSDEQWRNYKDLFVIAFPTPQGDAAKPQVPDRIASNFPDLALKEFVHNQKSLTLKPSEKGVVFDAHFSEKITLRTVELPAINSFSHPWCYEPGVTVTVYALNAGNVKKIGYMEMPSANWQDDRPISIACEEAEADTYRVEIKNEHEMKLNYIRFYTGARLQNWESEAAWTLRNLVRGNYPKQSPDAWVTASKIKDVTRLMDSSGNIRWNAPKGRWTIMRIGHVNTGKKNGPAPPEATGWEATKLDVSGARANFNGYIGRLIDQNQEFSQGLLNGILIDSWECNTQTWTYGLDNIFDTQWNYPLFSMFPALFGYVVDDPETTSKFLRDWRVTLNKLLVKNFFGEMKDLAKKNNLKISFETASGDVFPGDIMEYYKYADNPMCEFWQPKMDSFVGSIEFKPVKPTVSAARVYGKKRVAAEAFTSFNLTWNEHPGFLKERADDHFARGVTHLVFHTYTHNPRTNYLPPATSFGSNIGTPFNRLQTWWQHMPEFTSYLARCGYMLEAGRPVSDVLLYLGDEQNHKPPQSLSLPRGYDYDYCNPDVLLNRLEMKNGKLETPEGLSYRVLWLYDCKRMVPETLEKITKFVEQGLILVGEAPQGNASLSGGRGSDERLQKAVRKLWGTTGQSVRNIGKGKVYNTQIETVLRDERIQPSIVSKSDSLQWLHRRTPSSDLYFIATPAGEGYTGTLSFQSKGVAEIWDPVTGNIYSAHSKFKDGFTKVELDLPAESSCFVVFRKMPSVSAQPYPQYTGKTEITQPWNINFPKGWGIDEIVRTDQLSAWKNLPLTPEGRSFSGTAIYSTNFKMNELLPKHRYFLDLGKVEMMAGVKLNGKDMGTRWTFPYIFNITPFIRRGENALEIEVTSTWFNRLVYDANQPEAARKTWTISGPRADSQLKEYGLLGPVHILTSK